MRLDVPFFKQRSHYDCGPAAVRMVLAFFGIHARHKKLVELLKPTKILKPSRVKGTDEKDLVYAVSGFNLYPRAREKTTLRYVVSELRKGRPVIVGFLSKMGRKEHGHFAVVVGEERGILILHDPWKVPNIPIKKSDFLKKWRSESGIYERWMLSVDRLKT